MRLITGSAWLSPNAFSFPINQRNFQLMGWRGECSTSELPQTYPGDSQLCHC